jgi:GT2 family glycosyltransferase
MTTVAVVILNYNGEKLLPVFLPSVITHSAKAKIIVVDNASTDSSVALLKKQFPEIEIHELDKNYGFCGGYNRALKSIGEDIVILLNSDIEVTPGWLDSIINLFEKDDHVVAVQPKVLSYHQKTVFEYAGAAGGFIDSLGYPFCRGRIFTHVETDHGQYNDEREIFWATGACLAIRTKTFHQFGGLDEDLFAHMEEIDLCWKIHRASLKILYTGKSTVYHVGAGTLGYENPFKTFLNFRNGLILIYKHLDSGEMMYKLPFRLLLDWIAALLFLFKGQTKSFTSVLKAHVDFLRHLNSHRAKRKEIHKMYPTYPKNGIFPGLIVAEYYLKRKRVIDV